MSTLGLLPAAPSNRETFCACERRVTRKQSLTPITFDLYLLSVHSCYVWIRVCGLLSSYLLQAYVSVLDGPFLHHTSSCAPMESVDDGGHDAADKGKDTGDKPGTDGADGGLPADKVPGSAEGLGVTAVPTAVGAAWSNSLQFMTLMSSFCLLMPS